MATFAGYSIFTIYSN